VNLPVEFVPYLPQILESPTFRAFGLDNLVHAALLPLYYRTLEQRMLAEAIEASMAENRQAPHPPKRVALREHAVSAGEFRDGLACPICLSQFGYKEPGVVKLKCDHVFHKGCLGPWFRENHTCPMCRADIDEG
jgi:hypothetical protein